MNTSHVKLVAAVVLACFSLVACNTTTVKTTSYEPVVLESEVTLEELLLDVGVGIFNPGTDALSVEEEGVFPKIREAEARFMPYKLMETLQHTGNWGVVRVIPDRLSEMDLWVDGEILKSDGENLWLQVTVEDASGKRWFSKKYTGLAGKYSYDDTTSNQREPFQKVYNQIANDMLVYRNQFSASEIRNIRTIAELKFARDFSPEVFHDYLALDEKGRYVVKRLPAAGDPSLQQVRQIRERDYIFVDTLQQYYASFVNQMEEPYTEWREGFYLESQNLKEVRAESNAKIIGGALAVLAGILAQGVDSRTANTAGHVGILAGLPAVWSGLQQRKGMKIHIEALEEISASLNSEIEPHSIELEDRTVTLSGTVNEQYGQWRRILKEIHATETGSAVDTVK
ncbi:MAG: hypothetical protein OXI88_03415 [Gammaproteobacteria bacterium]|nr:hypothetical protein [Gammaproteobacteria bacterium]